MKRLIGHEIHVLGNLIGRHVDNSPVRIQLEDVTGNNAWIIGFIADHAGTDVFQRDLEQRFGITRSTASKVVSLMERKGLIERQSIPYDARLKKLVLTARSWEIVDRMEKEFDAIEDCLGKGFTEDELNRFFDYMARMQENISSFRAE